MFIVVIVVCLIGFVFTVGFFFFFFFLLFCLFFFHLFFFFFFFFCYSFVFSRGPIEYKNILNRSISPIDGTLKGIPTPDLSGPGSNGSEEVLPGMHPFKYADCISHCKE